MAFRTRSRGRVPLQAGDRRSGLRSGVMLRRRKPPAWAIVAPPSPGAPRADSAPDWSEFREGARMLGPLTAWESVVDGTRRSTTPAEKPQSGREASTGRRVGDDHWTLS